MNENEKIDLSALDPSRDGERWEGLISSIAARALRRRRSALPRQLMAWARPTLIAAAVLMAAVWTAALSRRPPRADAEPVYVLSQWAASGEVPSTNQILEVLGDTNGAR